MSVEDLIVTCYTCDCNIVILRSLVTGRTFYHVCDVIIFLKSDRTLFHVIFTTLTTPNSSEVDKGTSRLFITRIGNGLLPTRQTHETHET